MSSVFYRCNSRLLPDPVSLFWKQELEGKGDCPVRCSIRAFYIVIGLQPRVDRLVANLENPPGATTNGYCPPLAGRGVPVGRNNHVGNQKPAVFKVVINKGLKEKLIDVLAILVTGK